MLLRLQHLFSWVHHSSGKQRAPKPSVLAITPFYMEQLALRIASSRENWDLLICPTFRSGLCTLRKSAASVILYDLDTRDIDWRRGLYLLLAQAGSACVIVLARNWDDDLWLNTFERGAYDFQSKPLKDNPRLIGSVRAAHTLVTGFRLPA